MSSPRDKCTLLFSAGTPRERRLRVFSRWPRCLEPRGTQRNPSRARTRRIEEFPARDEASVCACGRTTDAGCAERGLGDAGAARECATGIVRGPPPRSRATQWSTAGESVQGLQNALDQSGKFARSREHFRCADYLPLQSGRRSRVPNPTAALCERLRRVFWAHPSAFPRAFQIGASEQRAAKIRGGVLDRANCDTRTTQLLILYPIVPAAALATSPHADEARSITRHAIFPTTHRDNPLHRAGRAGRRRDALHARGRAGAR